MVAVDEKDCDVLRFLWPRELDSDVLKRLILRFTCVVFTVSSSLFLLNTTINYHIKSYRDVDPFFVEKLLSSIYVDDISFGLPDVESMFQLYQKSKEQLAEAGFKLRKFITNLDELQQLITNDSKSTHTTTDDRSYANISLGSKQGSSPEYPKILGVQWDFTNDEFVFSISDVARYMTDSEPTKGTVVGMVARFLDPLGILTPVTILFKMFFHQLCEVGVGWDNPLTDDLLER